MPDAVPVVCSVHVSVYLSGYLSGTAIGALDVVEVAGGVPVFLNSFISMAYWFLKMDFEGGYINAALHHRASDKPWASFWRSYAFQLRD
ncbi:hypothetical protein IOQ59_12040 [Pontibacterium sp. N1Y112]|uniref:Uncharacterized protein n=1 Tax=Pontibacterium sinense TaxID=2781979 RepID=A0A8J7FE32_9GAMM|nr:hypothetical protein [Pontibacterium sinense]MBE9397989.1 hypothetical protein [Pontibacterium sinense]